MCFLISETSQLISFFIDSFFIRLYRIYFILEIDFVLDLPHPHENFGFATI